MIRVRVLSFFALLLLLAPAIAIAQQTGAIAGKVTDTSGAILPGVTIEARSAVLPSPRVTQSGANGEYRLPALPPGTYTVKFELSGMQTVQRQALVQLGQDTIADATLGVGVLTEAVTVTAATSLVERDSATIKSGVSSEQITSLPVGQEYRDLIKLIPGVMYTQDGTRGPSAGGSGQDNVYQFDGANVTLPLFGTLASEPASHDIAQVTTIKGGARAIDFDRSGGFTIDSASKSGTNRFSGELAWEYQGNNMVADLVIDSASRYEQDRQWLTLSGGGPILPQKLFFYASFYRPQNSRDNRANFYGPLPSYQRERNEGFGKLTFTPTNAVLLNFSYRDSHRLDKSALFASTASSTTGSGDELWQNIMALEGSWVVNSRSHATFKFTRFDLDTLGRPDNIANVEPSTDIGTRLDLNALDRLGLFSVPSPISGQTAFNEFIQPYLNRYGYIHPDTGLITGGGTVGYATQFNDQDFFRDNIQFAYNVSLGGRMTHDLHVGYQWYRDVEDLLRYSNGWGSISVPGGRLAPPAGFTQPAFFTATFQAQTGGGVSPIKSEYRSQSFEINDTIRLDHWTFNVGVLASNDTLFGQGLVEDSSKPLTGFRAQQGSRYEMYDIPFSKMIQPRLAATYAYNGADTLYASFARYNPAASSLPRAASWDRNLIGLLIDAHFDANGVLFASLPRNSSSGKLFVEDLDPRVTSEFLVGTARQFKPSWSGRFYLRHRRSSNFWEDTNNTARLASAQGGFNPPQGIPREPYIPDLTTRLAEIGSGSTYVIAALDGAYTRYYEATFESEWRAQRGHFVRGSYTWSRYYGNMDQDNSSLTANDSNIFIGSSNIADGAGRQLWDSKDGILRGDRPHMFKIYGFYQLPWQATLGAFAVAQSGQPWEGWSVEPYRTLTSSTDVTNRYAERAGIRRTPAHGQMDLKYIQNFRLHQLGGRTNLQLVFDIYNIFDEQTGYNFQPSVTVPTFNTARNYYDPRRLHVTARIQF